MSNKRIISLIDQLKAEIVKIHADPHPVPVNDTDPCLALLTGGDISFVVEYNMPGIVHKGRILSADHSPGFCTQALLQMNTVAQLKVERCGRSNLKP